MNLQWQEWNEQGFFPGAEESEVAFQERVSFCQNLEENLRKLANNQLPFETNNSHSKEILEQTLSLTKTLYGIQPRWVPLFFGNYQLAPWHGGCAWIFQINDNTPTSAFLQLRSHFRNRSTFLGIYHRNELIAHELSHVGRMLYQEPQFEEFFAYQSSPSSWRRWMGPIVQSSKESFYFILLLGFVIMVDFALLFSASNISEFAWWTRFLPLIVLILALGRLTYRHHILKRCLKQLQVLVSPLQAKHLLYRLLDHEIKLFSRLSHEKIENFIKQAADQSFRWRFLKTIYFKSSK